ncbi:hypothetical protein NPIL_32351 [Nephila pilipes]|uniref:Uncharacterized protein n=1 Tax=Nephila pilipes TaxID=299642 RepID=A0A8X6U699_NEPPI|nr:hypothetical protein NPIL_32351 [Nephila pilipes]
MQHKDVRVRLHLAWASGCTVCLRVLFCLSTLSMIFEIDVEMRDYVWLSCQRREGVVLHCGCWFTGGQICIRLVDVLTREVMVMVASECETAFIDECCLDIYKWCVVMVETMKIFSATLRREMIASQPKHQQW